MRFTSNDYLPIRYKGEQRVKFIAHAATATFRFSILLHFSLLENLQSK
jgi:hypothetical protein